MLVKQGKTTKIALIGYTLADGGLERAFSSLSQLLQDSYFEVHLIVLENKVAYPYYGTLINLGKYSKLQKYIKLKKYLNKQQFDYIIDFRYRINPLMELVFLYYLYSGFKFIYTIHSSVLEHYFTSSKVMANQIFSKAFKIVSVSSEMNAIIKKKYGFEKGIVISNVINNKIMNSEASLPFKYCLAIGRLVSLKQFDQLITTYCKSDLPNSKIHLVIIGEGEEKDRLQKLIQESQYSNYIHLLGFKENTSFYCKEALFLVLTSKYEGFPMVILEALSVGTTVISFDCKTGPSELITNEENGLLVDNQNFEALKIAMNRMLHEKVLYTYCKENTKGSVAKFSSEKISQKWITLLKSKTE